MKQEAMHIVELAVDVDGSGRSHHESGGCINHEVFSFRTQRLKFAIGRII